MSIALEAKIRELEARVQVLEGQVQQMLNQAAAARPPQAQNHGQRR